MQTEIPYKKGTKKFLVAQRLLKDEPYDKIEKDLRVARGTIYTVKSELKRIGIGLVDNPATSPISPASPELTKPNPEAPAGESHSLEPIQISPDMREGFGQEMWLMARPIMRKVALNPKVFLWYDYAVKELGFEGDIGDLCVDAIEDFFKSRGYKITIVKETEIA